MNEYEVQEAAQLYALHPILGPATRTLVNLVEWTNSNSDGWPYWIKPRQAAAKLIALIGDRRNYLDDPDRADVTADAYKKALAPVKAFRTKQEKGYTGVLPAGGHLFEIIDLGPGVGGEVWVLALAVEDARQLRESKRTELAAAQELLDRAEAELAAAQHRRNLATARDELAAGALSATADLGRLAGFDVGDRLWLQHPVPSPEPGLGEVATVTGLTYKLAGAALTYVTDDGREGQAYRPMALADARDRFWILNADRTSVIAGGFDDELRTARVQADQFPDGVVASGASFIPGPIDRDAVRSGDTVTYRGTAAPAPGVPAPTGTVEYAVAEHVYVITGGYRYPIPWRLVLAHTPRTTDALAELAGEDA